MITLGNQAKYFEWLSASEMHQVTLNWYSELNFIKEEQFFFDDLIKSYTHQLINSNHFEASKLMVEKLDWFQKDTELLIEIVKTHRNSLQILVDGINQLDKEAAYKKEHKLLVDKLASFKESYALFKKSFFDFIKNIIKEDKQNRLLNK
jgi:L-cysteine desulfidase